MRHIDIVVADTGVAEIHHARPAASDRTAAGTAKLLMVRIWMRRILCSKEAEAGCHHMGRPTRR